MEKHSLIYNQHLYALMRSSLYHCKFVQLANLKKQQPDAQNLSSLSVFLLYKSINNYQVILYMVFLFLTTLRHLIKVGSGLISDTNPNSSLIYSCINRSLTPIDFKFCKYFLNSSGFSSPNLTEPNSQRMRIYK